MLGHTRPPQMEVAGLGVLSSRRGPLPFTYPHESLGASLYGRGVPAPATG